MPYPGQIVSASRGLALLLTPGANASRDVLQEVQIAHHEHKLIVPVIVRNPRLCDDLRYFLGVRRQIACTESGATTAALGDVFALAAGGRGGSAHEP